MDKYRLYISNKYLTSFDNEIEAKNYMEHFTEIDKSENKKPRKYHIKAIKV